MYSPNIYKKAYSDHQIKAHHRGTVRSTAVERVVIVHQITHNRPKQIANGGSNRDAYSDYGNTKPENQIMRCCRTASGHEKSEKLALHFISPVDGIDVGSMAPTSPHIPSGYPQIVAADLGS